MTKEMLDRIKEFADQNFCSDNQITVDDPEFAVSNPWMDHSGRFSLNDEEAVREWGLPLVIDFCEQAQKILIEKSKENSEFHLCGMLYKHGEEDYSAFQCDFSESEETDLCVFDEKFAVEICGCEKMTVSDVYREVIFSREATELDPILCGYVWKHNLGKIIVDVFELREEEEQKAELFLERFATSGGSVRNCFDMKFSDLF